MDKTQQKPDMVINCPICGRSLTRYSGSNIKMIGNSCVRAQLSGHCPTCNKLFNWTEEYRIYLATTPQEVIF